jgi:hypothetical protein
VYARVRRPWQWERNLDRRVRCVAVGQRDSHRVVLML